MYINIYSYIDMNDIDINVPETINRRDNKIIICLYSFQLYVFINKYCKMDQNEICYFVHQSGENK